MNLSSIIILASCVAIGILIDLFIVVNFISRVKLRKRFYKEIAAKAKFKPIEADSYVLKTNRFGDIIKNDFLLSRGGSVKITGGIMKYNADEHIVFCDCLIEGTSNSGEKRRPFGCNAILHLRKIAITQSLKVRLDSKVTGKCPAIFDDLKFAFQAEGFNFSSDVEITIEAIPPAFLDLLKEYQNRFPFAKLKENGLLIVNDKGTLVLSALARAKAVLEGLIEFDRRMVEAFSKTHV